MLINAHGGEFVSMTPLGRNALSRVLYNNGATTPFWVEGDALPTSDYDSMQVLSGAQDYYNTLYNMFSRRSYDNKGFESFQHFFLVVRFSDTCHCSSCGLLKLPKRLVGWLFLHIL